MTLHDDCPNKTVVANKASIHHGTQLLDLFGVYIKVNHIRPITFHLRFETN